MRQHDETVNGGQRPYGTLRIVVRREHVFEDSFHQLRSRTPEEMRCKLSVSFQVRACVCGCVRAHVFVCVRAVRTPFPPAPLVHS